MNLLILGAGHMGSAFARQFSRAGHGVRLAASTLAKARAVALDLPGVMPVDAPGGAERVDVVLVATPYAQAVGALATVGSLDGKVIVDITNPMNADFSGLALGHETSAAEEIAKAFPRAAVVKAFNTLFAQVIAEGAAFPDGAVAPVFVAADSGRAKATATTLAESIGFAVVDAGPLKHARYLEPLAALNIHFGYAAGHGTGIAPAWLRR